MKTRMMFLLSLVLQILVFLLARMKTNLPICEIRGIMRIFPLLRCLLLEFEKIVKVKALDLLPLKSCFK